MLTSSASDVDEDPLPIAIMPNEKVVSSSSNNDTIKETEEQDCEDSEEDSSCHNIADLSFDMATHI